MSINQIKFVTKILLYSSTVTIQYEQENKQTVENSLIKWKK
jgi:hypothetical protein